MVDVGLESVVVQYFRTQIHHVVVVEPYETVALPADEVVMTVLMEPLIDRFARAQVGLGDQPQLLEDAGRPSMRLYTDMIPGPGRESRML